MPLLFGLSLFVSAALLFWIEPMCAKMILPLLGGSPAVWNTCMAFYQVVLLAGYIYAHLTTRWLGVQRQVAVHVVLLLLVFIALPIGINYQWSPPVTANPIGWLFLLLAASIGLPFFTLSATAPLLQAWFVRTDHPSATDPYFLYSASNLGSMVALLGYPFLIEPLLPLRVQAMWWSGGYLLLTGLISVCALVAVRASRLKDPGVSSESSRVYSGTLRTSRPGTTQRIRWVLLAFAPSSLLLGVTNYISTDIAQIPLFWILPLALYLLTFILVFAPRRTIPHTLMVRIQPFFLLPLVIPFYWGFTILSWVVIPVHLLAFFVTAMVCHGELANSRPDSAHLTEFYLWMSVGGVLGGFFNALAAPVLFTTPAEYPLILVLACLLRPYAAHRPARTIYDRLYDIGLPLAAAVAFGVLRLGLGQRVSLESTRLEDVPGLSLFVIVLISCAAGVLCLSLSPRPIRFGLSVGGIILAGAVLGGGQTHVLYAERNFFGVAKVMRDAGNTHHLLFHGTTLHGAQNLKAHQEPLTYFHRTGPLGQLFLSFSHSQKARRIAIIGLGTGSMASYSEPGQEMTFFEIDPAVERIARDSRFFTFLDECRARLNVVLGDARLSLVKAPDRYYDLLILDAFSSDSIPVHLVTREALDLYLTKLADNGILVFHISNRYLKLKHVLGNLASDAHLAGLLQEDRSLSDAERAARKCASDWVVMARRSSAMGSLVEDPRWRSLPSQPGARLWTDDFSNILSVFKWHGGD